MEKINKINKFYGQLQVISYLGNGKYDCVCECGKHRIVPTGSLRNDGKGVYRCNNCQKTFLKQQAKAEKVGKRFGMLEVKEYLSNGKYKCLCDCGNFTIVDSKDLSLGKHRGTKSCGCLTPHYGKDENFFEIIDTEEKAYIAGFVAVDGTVVKNKTSTGLKITLNSEDKELLYKIKDCMKYTGDIKTNKIETILPQGKKCSSESSTLFIANRKIVEDLINLGITSKKSLKLKIDFNKIPKDLIRHFLRGYWDGDGTIHLTKSVSGKISYHVVCMSSKDFCTQMKEVIESFLPEINVRIEDSKYNELTKQINFSTKNAIKDFGKFLYDDATIYLERKYQRHLKNLKNLEKINNCPNKNLKNIILE